MCLLKKEYRNQEQALGHREINASERHPAVSAHLRCGGSLVQILRLKYSSVVKIGIQQVAGLCGPDY